MGQVRLENRGQGVMERLDGRRGESRTPLHSIQRPGLCPRLVYRPVCPRAGTDQTLPVLVGCPAPWVLDLTSSSSLHPFQGSVQGVTMLAGVPGRTFPSEMDLMKRHVSAWGPQC